MSSTIPQYHMVFDVESIGLHGEGFAVAYVVIGSDGRQIEEDMFSSDPRQARGTEADHAWARENIPDLPLTHPWIAGMRQRFWAAYLEWKYKGALLWADCAWPVEAKFLLQCIEDNAPINNWRGPYPLHEIATLMLDRGFDPLADYRRTDDEQPKHNPLMDARQSARILGALLRSREATP